MMHHLKFQSAIRSLPMFSILRFFVIVGVIFYYSPVRQQGEGTAAIEAWLSPKKEKPPIETAAPPPADNPGRLETMWQALPDSAKQVVIDKILTTSGLGTAGVKATDTLQPGDRQPSWRGDGAKPRT